MLNLIAFLFFALAALAVGFARQEERKVTVPLKSSVTVKGATYHPNSKGVTMPLSHAKALGFGEDDYLGDPEEKGNTSTSGSEGLTKEQGAASTSNSKDNPDQKDASNSDSGVNSEGEGDSEPEGSKEDPEEEKLPEDTPELDKLIVDERFSTVTDLLKNKDQLTDIKGVGPATAEDIIEHVTAKKQG